MADLLAARVSVHALVTECSRLALIAGKVIQDVHNERITRGNSILNGYLKEEGDVRSVATVADIRAQRLIVASLKRKFPGICIVGEEDDDQTVPGACIDLIGKDSINDHPFVVSGCLDVLLSAGSSSCCDVGHGGTWALDSIVVFIDPLDGTHEFVQGRVGNVQTLIGISVNGYPVAGLMGLPFWGQCQVEGEGGKYLDIVQGGSGGAVIAGVVGVGTFGFRRLIRCSSDSTADNSGSIHRQGQSESFCVPLRLACSQSALHPALVAVQNLLKSPPFHAIPMVVPACGNKILSLLRGDCDACVFNLKTSLWDTCATQAVLVAAGGRVTDLVGCAINHSHPATRSVHARSDVAAIGTGNIYGVVATAPDTHNRHSEMVRCIRLLPEVTALFASCGLQETSSSGGSATDICRDTFGAPLTAEMLSQLLGEPVVSYSCPETDAQRYLMSEAARLYLTYADGASTTDHGGDNNDYICDIDICGSSGNGKKEITGRDRPGSIFYKRAVMRDLPHVAVKARTAPAKLARDVQSYLVEASFLACNACTILSDNGSGTSSVGDNRNESGANASSVWVAKCRRAEIFPSETAIDSKFSLLLEDFSPSLGWHQSSLLNSSQLLAGVCTLARFHAFFWHGGVHNRLLNATDVEKIASSVWPVASHWAPSRQPAEMIDQIADLWRQNSYADVSVGFGNGSVAHMQLGERLQRVARQVATECHFDAQHIITVNNSRCNSSCNSSSSPSGGDSSASGSMPALQHPHRTVIHGDAKAGNLFFRKKGNRSAADDDKGNASDDDSNADIPHPQQWDVGLIDFQWCGFGLGATDLAYYIAASASSDAVDVSGAKELALLQSYHTVLTSELVRLSRDTQLTTAVPVPVPSLEELQSQYEAGLLDICRIAFAYHWGRIPASPQVFTPERRQMMGPCAYNKDTDIARWLVLRCDALLRKREQSE